MRTKGQADRMAFDVSKAALPALWKADPTFVELAKYLYGDQVTLEDVAKDLFGKMDPGQSDVHARGPVKVGRKKKPLVVDERGIEKNLEVIGKFFVELVEKGYEAGLLDERGRLNEVEINKSREYARDHAGRFASHGAHVGRMVGGLAVAGAMAGTGALMATKSPAAMREAGAALKEAGKVREVARNLNHADPVVRHAARAIYPHALKATGKAVGTAGLSAVAGAGGVYEGTHTYTQMREHAVHGTKAARLEEVEKFPGENLALRAGAEYVSRGTKAAGRIEGYAPKHAATLGKIKRIRRALGGKVGEAALDPSAPATALREATRPMGDITKAQRRDNKGRFAAGAGVAAYGVGASGAVIGHDVADDAFDQRDRFQARQGDAMLRHEFEEPVPVGAKERAHYGFHPAERDWADHARLAEQGAATWAKRGKAARRLAHGATGVGVAGLAGIAYGVHEWNKHGKEEKAARYDHDVTWEGDFTKVDEDKRQVFGWASVTEMDGKPVVDLQGDYIHPDDVEKAAYDYVLKSRVGGDMHTRVDEYGNVIEKADRPMHVSDLIESMVFTPEKCEAMGVSKELSGRWWTGFQVNDPDVWADVKSGRRTGFSIHGAGMRKSIDISELDPEAELIGKAYQESDSVEELADNLNTLYEVTGHEDFAVLAKHLIGRHIPEGVSGHTQRKTAEEFSPHLGPGQRTTSHQRSEHKAYKQGQLLYGHALGDYNKKADRVNAAIDQAESGKSLAEHHFDAGHESGGVWATHKETGQFGLWDPAHIGQNTKDFKVHTTYKQYKRDHAGKFAKHLAHGLDVPQVNAQQARNAGVFGSMGSGVGGLAGGAIGAKFGHVGEGAAIGATVGGMSGTGYGMHHGKERPQRPPSVHAAMGGEYGQKAARYVSKSWASASKHLLAPVEKGGHGLHPDDVKAVQQMGGEGPDTFHRFAHHGLLGESHVPAHEHEDFGKAVDNTNRMGGLPTSRQGFYQQYALQQATDMLAPQVAQHIQAMQEQRWQQQMIEQQMLQQQAQQAPQDFSVQMGPFANHSQGSDQSQTSNPLTPSQQPSQQGPSMGMTPSSGPSTYQPMGA